MAPALFIEGRCGVWNASSVSSRWRMARARRGRRLRRRRLFYSQLIIDLLDASDPSDNSLRRDSVIIVRRFALQSNQAPINADADEAEAGGGESRLGLTQQECVFRSA